MKLQYIRFIIRDFKRNKLYSLIKVGGFALGIATCMLIAISIQSELGWDKHYRNTDNLYRVVRAWVVEDEVYKGTCLQEPLAPTIMDEFPEVENAGRVCYTNLFGAGENQFRTNDSKVNNRETGFAYADQNLLEILEINVIKGDAEHALLEPNSIVITREMEEKYFQNEDPVGKTLILNNYENRPYTITAVIENFPERSHMDLNFFMTLSPNIFGQLTCWTCNNYHTYVRLKEGADPLLLEKKLRTIIDKYESPYRSEQGNVSSDRSKDFYQLQPVKDIHLKSGDLSINGAFDYAKLGDMRMVIILGATALFILLIACINFINLSTAKYTKRAKEVGLKKAVGANKLFLVRQFLTESIFYSIISFVFAFGLAIACIPVLSKLTGKSFTIPSNEWWFIPSLVLSSVFIGILAGLYPSFYLSSFKPVKILSGKFTENKRNLNFRNGLVVLQFAASIVLIISTLVIYKQLNFILNKDLGFNREQVVVLHNSNSLGDDALLLRDELKKLSSVQSASLSSYLPVDGTRRNGNTFWNEGKKQSEPGIGGQNWVGDYDYIETLGLKLVEGRNFSKDIASDRQAAIVNKEMVKQLGLNDPIGKYVETWRKWKIIGVVEDFNFNNLHDGISPLLLRFGYDYNKIMLRVNSEEMGSTIKSITKVWDEFSPNQAIHYSFLDSDYEMMYNDIQRTGKIFRIFSALAIIVALLGLYGLAEFITLERTKEIGVRKVNGAKIVEILALLNKDFIKWVMLAMCISMPLGWYGMSKWLSNFEYSTRVSWWIFVIAGLFSVIVALLTVSYHSLRASVKNPVEALRYE